jgi:hypothetical protein
VNYRSSFRLALVPAVWLCAACFPFVSPPAKLSFAGGATPAPITDPLDAEKKPRGVGEFRAAIQPLGLSESLHDRRFDLGVGYVAHDAFTGDTSVFTQGPYVELDYFPWQRRKHLEHRIRWGARASADLLFADIEGANELGFGGLVGFGFEYTGFAGLTPFVTPTQSNDGEKDGALIGVAHGEWSIGVFAGASVRHVAGQTAFAGLLGLEGRLPFAAGIICCAWSKDDDDD